MLTRALLHILAVALALLVLTRLDIGVEVESFYTAVVVALLWGLITLVVRPVLALLTLPINILTLGLFSFVLNALLFWFMASVVEGFAVHGFVPALIGSAVLSLVSFVLHRSR